MNGVANEHLHDIHSYSLIGSRRRASSMRLRLTLAGKKLPRDSKYLGGRQRRHHLMPTVVATKRGKDTVEPRA
jgi:hypothetical protein